MAEYIDRQEAKKWIADWFREDRKWHPYSKGKNIPTGEVFDILCRIPAADVQPVKHGRWILDNPQYLLSHCSECRCFNSIGYKWEYCPNCGAKMDGEDNV